MLEGGNTLGSAQVGSVLSWYPTRHIIWEMGKPLQKCLSLSKGWNGVRHIPHQHYADLQPGDLFSLMAGRAVTAQRNHPCRTSMGTCQITFTSCPVAGVQCSTAASTSEQGKVKFCKGTVLKKAAERINSASNISYEHSKVQEGNQPF